MSSKYYKDRELGRTKEGKFIRYLLHHCHARVKCDIQWKGTNSWKVTCEGDLWGEVTIEDLAPFPIHCPALGLELVYERFPSKAIPDNAASIDRVDPSKGYVKGNVAILSRRANRLKNQGSLEEYESIFRWLRGRQEAAILIG